ncbi:MAG TPA: superoxide dismutase family protein [Nocardioidaceae bacterium]|nr:superoxide dismutase family protein [Nocardioidaceae bacterium]
MDKRLRAALLLAAASTGGYVVISGAGAGASADVDHLSATLRDPAGHAVGIVRFDIDSEHLTVRATLKPSAYVTTNAFHGLHIHANGDPTNGVGCVADRSAASSTWFVAVDGHLSVPGQTHGHHTGDLPSPLIEADGSARLVFTTDRIDPAALAGRAVVLHNGPDNFGNVPTGTLGDQYTANSGAATDKTSKTGNAGDRVACGLVTR